MGALGLNDATMRRGRALAGVAAAAFLLAACSSNPQLNPFGNEAPLAAPTTPVTSQPLAGTAPQSESTIGTGPVRVALVVPLTQGAGQSVVGASLRNGADLALSESGADALTILVKDDRSTPDGARAAAQEALNEGAELFIGPLFAADVREVGRVARSAGKPVIGFSTDTTTAARGIYLLSFLIESYVDRIVGYAADKGKKSFAVLAPDNEYGTVALAEFQQEAARRGLRVMGIERYKAGGAAAAAQKIAALGSQIDALFVPEQAEAMGGVSQALSAAGIDPRRVQILGTGLWNDARVLNLPVLQGAWFAAPENAGFNAFAQRYKAKYGSDPTRIATLAYDAVSLAAALARSQGSQRFSESVLTASSGFNGADGVFRFRTDGQNERGLTVLQIASGSTRVLSPAPRTFGAGGNGT